MKAILKSLYQNSRNEKIKKLIFDAFNKNNNVRYFVTLNRKTPIPIIERLSKDEDYDIRVSVAKNPNTPVSILNKLSKDKDYYVRDYVYKNPRWLNRN